MHWSPCSQSDSIMSILMWALATKVRTAGRARRDLQY